MSSEILFEQRGGLAIATLNRPQALNAMSQGMYDAFAPRLKAWGGDPSVKMVVLRGNGPKGFCSGGDVRSLHPLRYARTEERALPATGGARRRGALEDPKHAFFADEYRFIFDLHRSLKPVVALAHGITFGGGAGLSVNSARRVASETFQLAMPEIFIGLIPDVGATRFFDRCPGKIGLYLALTGARVGAADAIQCGLFTHFVPQARFEELVAAFEQEPSSMDKVLERFAEPPGKAALPALRPAIDRCFGGDSVEEIIALLRDERDPWAKEALESMGRASPISLKLIFQQLKRGKGVDLAGSLKLEFRIVQHIMQNHDFFEGVRAVLVDKDRNPRWQFQAVEQVPDDLIEQYFASLGDRELSL